MLYNVVTVCLEALTGYVSKEMFFEIWARVAKDVRYEDKIVFLRQVQQLILTHVPNKPKIIM